MGNRNPSHKIKFNKGDKINDSIFLNDENPIMGHRAAKFQCKCGNTYITRVGDVRRGYKRSCGCDRFNPSKMSEYWIWQGIKFRCYNNKNPAYPRYGGRGIFMCDRWRNSFIDFLSDMGHRPTPDHSIERINNDGNYEPSNCKWATTKEQNRNTSQNNYITYKDVTKCISEWEETYHLPNGILYKRLYERNWTIEESLTTPPLANGRTLKR